jgi:hypothetical protein
MLHFRIPVVGVAALGAYAEADVSSLAMRSRLYAAPTRHEACFVRSRPSKRVFRKLATVFIQPKISSMRSRIRWLISYPRCRVVRPSMRIGGPSGQNSAYPTQLSHANGRKGVDRMYVSRPTLQTALDRRFLIPSFAAHGRAAYS